MEKGDFVKIAYTGKLKEGGEVFDKNEEISIVIGSGFVITGLDTSLQSMNVGEKKTIEIKPEDGFGSRREDLIKLIPENEFKKHNTNPYPGMFVEADNLRGRVLSVSSGRVKVDFNHPLAGKILIYDVEIKSKIEGIENKVKALVGYYTKIEGEKISVAEKGKEVDITAPPLIHPAIKNRISKDLNKLLGFETVKFSEIFKPTETVKEQEPAL
ncbi:MAG: peptidylprolyl isomerase [Candidatus Aenigmarchaeota archaeon]|nr:peptidylprolyl isomerase [Candidatus Aenigmarchaeota archaeon]